MLIEKTIKDFLTHRENYIQPDEANNLDLPRISKIDFDGNIHINSEKKTKTKMITVKNNDFVISGINLIKGAAAINKMGDAIATIHYSSYYINDKKIYVPFFDLFVKSQKFKDILNEKKRSGIKTEIRSSDFLNLKIQIPDSIEKQEKISEEINKQLAKINYLKSLIKDIKNQLKLIDEIVFSELFEETNKKGEQKNLFDLIENKPQNGYSPKPVNYETKVKSLVLSATTSGFFDGSKFKYIEENLPKKNIWLENGDILIQRGNAREYVGVSAVYKGENNKFIYPDLMIKIKCKENVLPEFLHCMLMSFNVRNFLRENAKGTNKTMIKINQETLKKIKVPFVNDRKFQEYIINKSKNYLVKTTKIKKILNELEIEKNLESQIIDNFILG